MLFKLGIVFSLWCVVSGSVLKIYLEDGSLEDGVVVRSDRACNNAQCNQICQLLGFARGLCQGNDCYCYWAKSKGILTESVAPNADAAVADLPVDNQESVSEVLIKSGRACDNSQCNQICRWLGFARGLCQGGDCYCYWVKGSSSNINDNAPKLQATSLKTDLHVSPQGLKDAVLVKSGRSCDNEQCNLICRWLGFARGVCEGNDCYCYWAKSSSSSVDADKSETTSFNADIMVPKIDTLEERVPVRSDRACNNSSCNAICRILGFAHGACKGNDCYCYRSKSSSIVEHDLGGKLREVDAVNIVE